MQGSNGGTVGTTRRRFNVPPSGAERSAGVRDGQGERMDAPARTADERIAAALARYPDDVRPFALFAAMVLEPAEGSRVDVPTLVNAWNANAERFTGERMGEVAVIAEVGRVLGSGAMYERTTTPEGSRDALLGFRLRVDVLEKLEAL